jgi:hypothetical protein
VDEMKIIIFVISVLFAVAVWFILKSLYQANYVELLAVSALAVALQAYIQARLNEL